jgi:hypothetical protein
MSISVVSKSIVYFLLCAPLVLAVPGIGSGGLDRRRKTTVTVVLRILNLRSPSPKPEAAIMPCTSRLLLTGLLRRWLSLRSQRALQAGTAATTSTARPAHRNLLE